MGNKNGVIGVGYGKSKETVPAREKAFRNAKLNIFKIRRGCGSWECMCGEPHSIPFMILVLGTPNSTKCLETCAIGIMIFDRISIKMIEV